MKFPISLGMNYPTHFLQILTHTYTLNRWRRGDEGQPSGGKPPKEAHPQDDSVNVAGLIGLDYTRFIGVLMGQSI